MFETRSQAWSEVGLLDQVSPRAAKRAAWEAALLGVLFVAVVVAYDNRVSLFGVEAHGSSPGANTAVRVVTVVVLLALGWAIARNFGRALGPALLRRVDPAAAGPVGFLIRLAMLAITLLVALSVAGVEARTLLVGGAFTAVILGLAAQQTLGNLFAGIVLLSARPFRVGDRVRLQGGPLAGQIEGTVSSQGLLYTTFVTGEDTVMVPNSVVLNVAVTAQPASRHAVAQEQVRVALQRRQQLQLDRRLEVRPGQDPQRWLCARERAAHQAAAGESGGDGQKQLVDQPGGQQLDVQVRSALAEQGADLQAIVQLGQRRGEVERPSVTSPSRRARTYSTRAAVWGRLSREGVTIATRASGSASSGRSVARARRRRRHRQAAARSSRAPGAGDGCSDRARSGRSARCARSRRRP